MAAGTPEEVAAEPDSATGRFLADLVSIKPKARRTARRKRVATPA
jgi:excinuclease UvrABC ATPase subunit